MKDSRNFRYTREDIQSRHANYIKNKTSPLFIPFSRFDEASAQLGKVWYYSGHKLEEADIKLQQDRGFVNGYNHAVTQDIVNNKLYEKGIEYFEKGIEFSDVPKDLASNTYFVQGYAKAANDVKKNSRR